MVLALTATLALTALLLVIVFALAVHALPVFCALAVLSLLRGVDVPPEAAFVVAGLTGLLAQFSLVRGARSERSSIRLTVMALAMASAGYAAFAIARSVTDATGVNPTTGFLLAMFPVLPIAAMAWHTLMRPHAPDAMSVLR